MVMVQLKVAIFFTLYKSNTASGIIRSPWKCL